MNDNIPDDEPCYVISIAAKMLGIHQQTLRYYEREGLVQPSRSRGNIRLYSISDINRLRQVQRLISDLGVNLAGAEVILRMSERMRAMEAELEYLRTQLGARDRES
jgi:MerR family transcriptional regulator/heat shock protein HspR